LILFTAAGCNPAAKFSVIEAGMPTLNGLSSLHGKATVANGGKRDATVESMNLTVDYRGRELGTARLLLPIEIPAGGANAIRYDFALEGLSLASLQTLQSRILVNPDAFTVDARGYVRWGGVRKKIELRDVPLVRVMGIISNFAP
jgi:hypothetical protein